jgi:hypothetical protein
LEQKRCGTCKDDKQLDEFNKDRSKPDGRSAVCRTCSSIRSSAWSKDPNNKERVLQSARKFEKTKVGKAVRKKIIQSQNQLPKVIERNKKYRNHYTAERKRNDSLFKLVTLCRARIQQGIKNAGDQKTLRSIDLIGCSWLKLRTHLEEQFQPGMSWSNRIEWHIDHIKPIAAFDITKEEWQRECFHYINLQPLWGIDNIKKSSWYKGLKYEKGEVVYGA